MLDGSFCSSKCYEERSRFGGASWAKAEEANSMVVNMDSQKENIDLHVSSFVCV